VTSAPADDGSTVALDRVRVSAPTLLRRRWPPL